MCLYNIDLDTGTTSLVGAFDPDVIAVVAGLTCTCVDPIYLNSVEQIFPGSVDGSTESAPNLFAGEEVAADALDVGSVGTLDTATGGIADVGGPLTAGTDFATGMAFAQDGMLWGVLVSQPSTPRTWTTATIDPVTGAATPIAPIALVDTQTELQSLSGLTFGVLDCAAPTPAPVVVTPTFTG